MSLPWALIDIGGTKTRIAISEDGSIFGEPAIFATPQKYDLGVSLIGKTALSLSRGAVGRAMAGIAGPLNPDQTGIMSAPNINDWNDKPLKKDLLSVLKCPVGLVNDTAQVGLGEAVRGAGEAYNIVAYVTLSTGFNGVRIVNKQIDVSYFGFEIGRQIVCCKDFPQSGSLESLVSSGGIVRETGKNPVEINEPDFWQKRTKFLACGIINTALYWSPEVIIIGGGLAHKYNLSLVESLIASVKSALPSFPKLASASLGDEGGLYGALHLLQTTAP